MYGYFMHLGKMMIWAYFEKSKAFMELYDNSFILLYTTRIFLNISKWFIQYVCIVLLTNVLSSWCCYYITKIWLYQWSIIYYSERTSIPTTKFFRRQISKINTVLTKCVILMNTHLIMTIEHSFLPKKVM